MAQRDVSFTIRAKDEASAAIKETKQALGELKDAAASMAGGIAAALGAVGLGEFFKQSITAAAEAEAAWARMSVAVKNAGGDFKAFQPEAERVIDLLSGKTKGLFEKDSMAAGLEKLIEVSGNAKGSLGALPIVLDLARAKHMDLEQAATLVGRVMTGNTSMLKRYGIVVDETKDAVAQLADKFRGFAEKDATTMLGTLDRLTVAWKEFEQAVGRALTAGDSGAGEGLIGFLTSLEHGITANEAAISHMIAPFREVASFFGGMFAATLKAVGGGLATLWISAEGLTAGLVVSVAKLTEALGHLVQLLPGLRGIGQELQSWGKATASSASADLSEKWREYVGMYDGANRGGGSSASGTVPGAPSAALSKADETALRSIADAIRHLGEETANGKTKAQQFAEKMDEVRRKMETTKGVTQQMREDFEALNGVLHQIAADEVAQSFEKLSVAMLAAGDDEVGKQRKAIQNQLDELQKERTKVAADDPSKLAAWDAQIAALTSRLNDNLAVTQALVYTKRQLDDLATKTGGSASDNPTLRGLKAENEELTKRRDQLRELQALLLSGGNTAGAAKVGEQVNQFSAAIKSNTEKSIALFAQYVGYAKQITDMIASVGGMDRKTQASLNAAGTLAQGGDEMANKKWLEGSLHIIEGLFQLGTALGAESEAHKAARLLLEQNNIAIYHLSDTLHSTQINATGADIVKAKGQLTQLTSAAYGSTDSMKTGMKELFATLGIDPTFLNDIAKQLGVAIDGTLGSYRELARAVDIANGKMLQFNKNFADQSSEYDAAVKIFGVTDPQSLLLLHAQAGINNSPGIKGLFNGIDTTKPIQSGDFSTLLTRVEAMYTQIMNGTIDSSSSLLGGLNRDQYIAVLEGLATDIRGLTGAVQTATLAIYGVPAGLHVSLEQYRATFGQTLPGFAGGSQTGGNTGTNNGNSGGTVTGAGGGTGTDTGGTTTVVVTLDGKVVATSVVKTLEAASARVNGTTTQWGSVPSGAI